VNNLLYLSRDKGQCENCGGHAYVSAVYLETSVAGWHLMIEIQCADCDWLDVIDVPKSDLDELAEQLTDRDAERAEAEEHGIPQYDDLGFLTGYKPPSDPADL
jgi:hypothetical protein